MKDLSIKKLYYSISEVSKITNVEQYVLRYWETEFEQLSPQKNRAGNRIYTNKDIQLIMKIKNLLRDKKFTIEGARNILGTEDESTNDTEEEISEDLFSTVNKENGNKKDKGSIKKDLKEIKNVLETILAKL
jgi:DNA-binding transcriptional MerR regulator